MVLIEVRLAVPPHGCEDVPPATRASWLAISHCKSLAESLASTEPTRMQSVVGSVPADGSGQFFSGRTRHLYYEFCLVVGTVCDGFFKYQIVPFCFLIWTLLVATALFRVVLMFQKALELTRKQGLAVAATFQACRGRSILQCSGVIISLTTSVMLYFSWAFHGFDLIFSPIFVIQCINLLVNTAGVTLLSGASSLITSQGTLKFPPLKCCQCPCQFARCHGFQFFKSLCRSKLKICEENAWEKKTRELANRGISLEELLVFYKNLGDTVMQSFQTSVHTTTDVSISNHPFDSFFL